MCLFCMAAIVSCQQEEEMMSTVPETVTLTLNIGTQSTGVSTRANDPNVQPYEGIRTLRALVISDATDPKDRKILYNQKHEIDITDAPPSAILSTTLQLENIPVGQASIYIIANEQSIHETGYTDDILMSPTYINDSKLLLLDEGWKYFPKTYEEIAKHGLPMSGKAEGVEITTDMQAISITLDRTVVKLHLTVENATNDELKLQWVEFGKFISDRVYLFRHTQLDVPESTLYKTLRYPETGNFSGVTLSPNGKTQWNSVYIYPNYAYKDQTGSYPYTLSLATDKKTYSPSQLSEGLSSMIRNTQFNITARITASATITIKYEKVDWEPEDINVPPFN